MVERAADGLRIVRGQAPGARWELTFGRCHRALAPYVREYCGYVETTTAPVRRREMPAAQVVIIIDFGPTLRLLDATGTRLVARHPGGFVAGIDDGFTVTETTGAMAGIQVNLTPIGARRLLGRPMHALARQVISLADAFGPTGRDLAGRLHDTPGWAARFRLLDDVFLARLSAGDDVPGWVAHAWGRIEASGGSVAIAELERELGYGRKHLAHVFREHVGMTPKLVARLVRFQHALTALRAGAPRDLARLALELGYHDQAHFTHEFRGFSGLTPGEALRRHGPDALGMSG